MTENEVLGFDPKDLFGGNGADQPQTQNNQNSFIYKTKPADSKSEDGVYRAKIKIVYNPENPKKSFLEQQSYGMQDKTGFFSAISSLTIEDKNCPIFTSWKKCHYSDPSSVLYNQALSTDKGGKGLYDKRFARYVIIQVLKDKNQPDLVGKFMLWKLPTSVYNILNQKMNPSKDSAYMPIPVMDYLFGRAFNIEVHPGPDDPQQPLRKTREISYTAEISNDVVSCINPDGSPILNDEEQDILDSYVRKIRKAWEMEAEDDDERAKRDAIVQEVNSSDEYKALLPIYAKVLAQIKEWAPKLDALSYKPWDDNLKKRVADWIFVVENGANPKDISADELREKLGQTTSDEGTTTSTKTTEEPKKEEPKVEEKDDTSDLPF